MIFCKKTDEWYTEWHQMSTSDSEWQQVVQRMTTTYTTSYNEWQGMTTSNKKWQWVTANDSEW